MAAGTLDAEGALREMRGLIFGFLVTRSIAVAAELGLADRLADGPRSASELAGDCGVLDRPLYRMLRFLAGEGIFTENPDGRFALSPRAELLRSGHSSSLRDWAIAVADLPFRTSIDMLHSLKTGEPAFPKVFGAPLFDYLHDHPEKAIQLFRAMSSVSAARIAGLLEAYDFSGIRTLADIGGAHGAVSSAIAKRYPNIHCTCLDLPAAELGALKMFHESGVADRCNFVEMDFFVDVPAGADAYLVCTVLHDWGDEPCLKILRNCRRRIPDDGRLVIVDIVLSGEKNVPDTYRNALDLAMLFQTQGGMERTESEFRELLAKAKFRLSRVIPMNAPQWVVEALPE
jgi:SAM-dependent methyltransferase